jgi:hypothetical protein
MLLCIALKRSRVQRIDQTSACRFKLNPVSNSTMEMDSVAMHNMHRQGLTSRGDMAPEAVSRLGHRTQRHQRKVLMMKTMMMLMITVSLKIRKSSKAFYSNLTCNCLQIAVAELARGCLAIYQFTNGIYQCR